jgi:hypothetical protein
MTKYIYTLLCVVLLLYIVKGQNFSPESCVLFNDFYIRHNYFWDAANATTQRNVTVKFHYAFRKGWAHFALGNTLNVNDTRIHFGIEARNLQVYQILNGTRQVNSSYTISASLPTIIYDQTLRIDAVIRMTQLMNLTTIFLAHGAIVGEIPQYTVYNMSLLDHNYPDCVGTVVPDLIGSFNGLAYTIVFVYLLVSFILFFFVRNKYPVNSRGLLPYATTFSWLMCSTIPYVLIGAWNNEVRNHTFCWSQISTIAFTSSGNCQYIYSFARYLIIINLNKHRLTEVATTKTHKARMGVRILGFFAKSKIWTIAQYILCFLGVYGFLVFVWGAHTAFSYTCDINSHSIMTYYSYAIVFLPNIFVICLAVIDMSLHIKKVCSWRFWFIEDPFYYRIECIILPILVLAYGTAYMCFDLSGTIVVNSFKPSLLFFGYWLWFLCHPQFIVVLTYWNLCRACCRKRKVKDAKTPLELILSHPALMADFKRFANREWSAENVMAKLAITDFKHTIPTGSRKSRAGTWEGSRKSQLESFYRTFLSGSDSIMEINAPKQQCLKIKSMLDKCDEKEPIPDTALDEIERTIDQNLFDTISRYIYTPMFLSYEKTNEMKTAVLSFKN